jgi:hypothetical protein
MVLLSLNYRSDLWL